MKSFNQWLEQREMSEGVLPLLGAFKAGPLGYQIGRSLEKSFNGNSRTSSPGMPYRYDKDEDDKKPWYQKDLMQYVPGTLAHRDKKDAIEWDAKKAKDEKEVKDMINKGWEPEDAKNFVYYYKKEGVSSPMFRYYQEKYPNYFSGSQSTTS